MTRIPPATLLSDLPQQEDIRVEGAKE